MQFPLTPPVKSVSPKQLNEQNSQQIQDDLKLFSVSSLIDKSIDIEKMDKKQLVNYCHNEWKQWIRCMIQLQQCIRQEEQTTYKAKTSEINLPQAKLQDSTNIELRRNLTLTNEDLRQNKRQMSMHSPAFLGKDFNNMYRPQNSFPIPQTTFMGGSLSQTGMTMKPSDYHQFIHNPSMNPHRNPFPFPFPQEKSITEGFSGGYGLSGNFDESIKMNFPIQDQSKNDEEKTQRKQ